METKNIKNRVSELKRETNETKIDVKVNLDGNGINNIKTGLPFFDHMLEQLSKHSLIDIIRLSFYFKIIYTKY